MLNFRTTNLCGIEFPPMPLEERPPSARRGAESFDATDHMFGSSDTRGYPNLQRITAGIRSSNNLACTSTRYYAQTRM